MTAAFHAYHRVIFGCLQEANLSLVYKIYKIGKMFADAHEFKFVSVGK